MANWWMAFGQLPAFVAAPADGQPAGFSTSPAPVHLLIACPRPPDSSMSWMMGAPGP